MQQIQFQQGRNRQAIYSGMCECGNVLTFTPGGKPVTCVQCGQRWNVSITAVIGKPTPPRPKPDIDSGKPKAQRKTGPAERKR